MAVADPRLQRPAEQRDDDFIPWAKPCYWGNEAELVGDALRSMWISGGPYVERFELELRSLLGSGTVLTAANGTAALHLAYLGLSLRPGDEVVVPAFAFQAAANVALLAGLRPVFCDVDPDTWCISASTVEPVLSSSTRAVVAVHTYGNVCEMESLTELASARGIPLIEDAAEAIGSRYRGRQAGTMGTVGTFSFHATKTITTGEGGAVVTTDTEIASRVALYRSHGLRRRVHYWHEVPGHNFRMTNLQAALGCAQIGHFAAISAARRATYDSYRNALAWEGVTLQVFQPIVEPLVWTLGVRLDASAFPQGRDAVMAAMLEQGIECRPGFYTPNQLGWYGAAAEETAERLAASVIALPFFPQLRTDQVDRICGTLRSLRR